MSNLQKHIDNVMDWFDFDRVHRAMVALDWKWVSAEDGVPNQAELRQQVRRLMKECYNKAHKSDEDFYGVGTGGFDVEYNKEWDEFKVKFVLSWWDSCIDDGVSF